MRALIDALGPALRGLSHITGGGLGGNLPRVLPDGLGARLDLGFFERPAIFRRPRGGRSGRGGRDRRTFNLGVGLCAVVAREAVPRALDAARAAGEAAWVLGEVIEVGDVADEKRVRFEA